MGEYTLRCAGCGSLLSDGATSCPLDSGLPRAEYTERRFKPRELPGIWSFIDWLPVDGWNPSTGASSVTYRSSGLAADLDLERLYISFSGYWPERGALMRTCSFKELEAAPTMQMLLDRKTEEILVVASAGNTARAFAEVCSVTGQPVILFVPVSSLDRLWTTVEPGRVLVVGVKGDYADAIKLAGVLSSRSGFRPEGGARNIARRDGMGTVLLDHVRRFDSLPDHYFQAIGSGTGGIAVWEASMRVIGDGRFGERLPRLHLAQNIPCAPVHAMWHGMSQEEMNFDAYGCPEGMHDDVLFNRNPPYAVPGGVRDAVISSSGRIYGIDNTRAASAQRLFERSEGIDILPAAAVAVAALIDAVESGFVGRDDEILLNVTGGGVKRLAEDHSRMRLKCDLRLGLEDSVDVLLEEILA
ncbi:MAG TPA: cysteate synthase [Methanothrix sp.]|nr:cysteate synthase [Methanothrix sp.]HOK59063.1 cysteate synthase [Methanothrix sp.]HOL44340.1 cysteate synthase [Methanothrix sp.]HPO89301.1 cysteate synthase [Methanothrix sp.]